MVSRSRIPGASEVAPGVFLETAGPRVQGLSEVDLGGAGFGCYGGCGSYQVYVGTPIPQGSQTFEVLATVWNPNPDAGPAQMGIALADARPLPPPISIQNSTEENGLWTVDMAFPFIDHGEYVSAWFDEYGSQVTRLEFNAKGFGGDMIVLEDPGPQEVMIDVKGYVQQQAEISLAGHFTPDTVTPLRDRQTSFDDASTTTLVVQASGSQVPAQMTVHLVASVDPHSGGHEEEAADRPVGRFLLPDGSAADQADLTLMNGYGKIPYRCSGFGGTDIVEMSAGSASTASVSLPVKFDLVDLGEESGPDRATEGWDAVHHVHLVGWTKAHPYHHYCLPAMQQILWGVAATYYAESKKDLEINDESLPDGGPFDLGPGYGVPWWSILRAHYNHREGNSADIPIGNRDPRIGVQAELRRLIAKFARAAHQRVFILQEPLPGEGVLPHWHIQIY